VTILIKSPNEVITLMSNVRGPRTKEKMREIAIVENGSILIEEDRIVAVGAFEQLEVDFP